MKFLVEIISNISDAYQDLKSRLAWVEEPDYTQEYDLDFTDEEIDDALEEIRMDIASIEANEDYYNDLAEHYYND